LIVIPHRASGAPQDKPPIEKEGILLALRHGVLSKEKLLAQITSRGVDFRLTESDEQEIRKAGTYLGKRDLDDLITAIRESYKILILMAEFQSLDNQKLGVTEIAINQLRADIGNYSDTRFEYLKEAITAQQGDEFARRKGKELGASFVIWGWYSVSSLNVYLNVHFTFVKGIKSWPICKRAEEETFRSPVAELQDYSLQTKMTEHMSYLTLLTTGLARLEANDLDSAIERFDRVLKLENVPEQIIHPAEVYRYRAYTLLLKDKYDLALSDWNKAIALKPDAWTYKTRGITNHHNLDYDSAINDYNKAISLNPNYTDAYYNRGLAYARMMKYEFALSDFSKAISLNPNHSNAHFGRALIYAETGKHDLAIE
jgi:tetratricopeptide (TPR) repeat protein